MEPAPFASVVLVDASLQHLNRAFTYAVPEGMPCAEGALVRVPFRGRNRSGVVIGSLAESDVERALPVGALLGPGLPPAIVSLARWTAERYLSTLGEALASAVPERVAAEEKTPPPAPQVPAVEPPAGTGAALARAIARDTGGRFVWRPAASEQRGRTIAAVAGAALARGAGVLVLVPEVRVHGDVVHALRTTLGEAVAWLGSDRPARARYRDWLALRAGAKRLAVGGRGAVFAPVEDLGLIVVDDEAHQSYKEGRAPRFHARTVASERARASGAALVLVGAPPSIEARAAVEGGSFRLIASSRTAELRARPPVTIVDRSTTEDRLVPASRTLTLAKREASAGRRVVFLTHRAGAEAVALAERVVRVLAPRTPAVLDARAGGEALHDAAARADCIVATPFVAKDLAVEGAGLLAIVEADAALAQPEFRAAEDAFATWWHAARWAEGGSIVIETAEPRHPAIAALARWDPDVLWRAEAARRSELGYPPFAALARIDVPSDRAGEVAAAVAEAAGDAVELLGPVERGGRSVLVVRARRREDLLDALRPLVDRWRDADEPMRVDVDPREVLVPKWRS